MKALTSSLILLVIWGLATIGCNDNTDLLLAPSDEAVAQTGQVTKTLAKKPTPNLVFATYANFLGGSPTWEGTATLEGIGTYGVRYFNLSGPPRDFSQAKPFEEFWEIYDLATPTIVYLAGTHTGVVSMANSRFLANGKVEVATGGFEMWLGRTTHNSGEVYWLPNGFPDHAEGTFRIN